MHRRRPTRYGSNMTTSTDPLVRARLATRRVASRRIALLVSAVLAIAVGLLVHWGMPGAAGDFLADALYAALIYLIVSFVVPRAPVLIPFALAFGFCLALELFQLTGIPLAIGDAFSPARLVLGSTFVGRDILAYGVGSLAIAALDWAVLRVARARRLRSGD
jgi:hypothetical protein